MAERIELPSGVSETPSREGFWSKLRRGLSMTHTEMWARVETAARGRATVDEAILEDLEESLIAADLGVETALELVERVREQARRGEGGDLVLLRQRLVDEVALLLHDAAARPAGDAGLAGPRVTLVVGVNGSGKTTSIAKLAHRARSQGRKVLLGAADTFRAAAVEQLALWGERLGVDVVRQGAGADPAAVVFDALQAARARHADEVLIDTAGRLHNKTHLMRELEKIGRVVAREAPSPPWRRRTLLVLDATTGQNALAQAREFSQVAAVDALLLAKLDGTAKGGIVVAVARELRLPVAYLGVGEGPEDLVEFRPRDFATALVGG